MRTEQENRAAKRRGAHRTRALRAIYATVAASVLTAAGLGATAAVAKPVSRAELKVGGIFDLTGITSDSGKSFARGIRDGVQWQNEHGGINGKPIKLIEEDYAYKIPEGVAAYKRMVHGEHVILVSGWGTGDTEALKDFVAQDKVPYVSGSFSGHLTDPARFPYNFFAAPSYSDQLRAWLNWVKEDFKDAGRHPRVAFFYGDNPYGRSPIEAGRQYCKEIGIDLVDEEILPGTFQDAMSQLLNARSKGADYVYVNVSLTGVSVVLRDARMVGMAARFGSNPYGFSEQLPRIAGEAAEGVTGVMPHPPFGADVPGMKHLVEFHAKHHPDDEHDAIYVRGWTTFLVWAEALRRADEAGRLDGEGIKAALESFREFDTGGLAEPLTYTATDHRPSTRTAIYQVQKGRLVKVAEYEMPRKSEWLGQ